MIAWGEPIDTEAAAYIIRASIIDLAWCIVGLAYCCLLWVLVVQAGWLVAVAGFAFSILFALAVPHMLDRYATRRKIGGGE